MGFDVNLISFTIILEKEICSFHYKTDFWARVVFSSSEAVNIVIPGNIWWTR